MSITFSIARSSNAMSSQDDSAAYVKEQIREKQEAQRSKGTLKIRIKRRPTDDSKDPGAKRKKSSVVQPKPITPPKTSRRKAPPKPQKSPKKRGEKTDIRIYVDSREPVLTELIKAIYPDLSESNFVLGVPLPTGDVRIDIDSCPVLLAERKEIHDFVGSLANNHLREQRARMLEDRKAHPQLILMFIVEGSFDSVDWSKRVKLTREHCEQVCRELVYKYNIHVVFRADQIDTLRYLGFIEQCYTKYGSPTSVIDNVSYLDNYYVGRKRALQQAEFSYMSLTLVEGVSADIAKSIMEVHATLPALIAAYEAQESYEACETLLQDITHGESGRRIGPALSRRIYHYLFNVQTEEGRE